MAGSIDDVDRVFDVMAGRDDDDAWSRDRGPRYDGGTDPGRAAAGRGAGVLRRRRDARRAHLAFPRASRRGTPPSSTSRWQPFLAAGCAALSGPWVAERLVEFGDFLAAQPDSIHPVVRDIFRSGQKYTAVDAFAALQRLQELKAEVGRLWRDDGRAGGADHRHHVHRRRGAGRRPSTATRCSATTPISAICSTCSASRFRSAPPPTAGPTARCCSAPR